jgi:flagellar biosynthesis GTPase FlhF
MIVWLASYPRSGNTFFRVLLNSIFDIKTYSIYNDTLDIGADRMTSEVVGHTLLPENADLEQMRRDAETYFIKTHDIPDSKVADEDKVIYLIRDGRESTLSFWKYDQQYGDGEKRVLEDVIRGQIYFGTWGDHVRAWDPENHPHTLLVKFEELVDDPSGIIQAISDFTGQKPVGDAVPSFEELQQINPKFFRSGKKDSWKKEYSEEQQLVFWMMNHSQMVEFGYTEGMPVLFEKAKNYAFFKELSMQNRYITDLLLRRQADELKEKEAVVRRQEKEIEHRMRQVVEKQGLIDERNRQLQEKQKTIEERNRQLQEKQKTIEERNRQLQERQKVIDEQKQQMQKRQKYIEEQERKLQSLNRQLEEKQGLIDVRNRQLEERQKTIDLKNEETASLKQWLLAEKHQREELDKKLKTQQEEKLALRNELGEKGRVLASLQASIDGICRVGTLQSPLKKIAAYKQMMQTFHDTKNIGTADALNMTASQKPADQPHPLRPEAAEIVLPTDDYYGARDKKFYISPKEEPLLIFQVGKVGSSTLYESLKNSVGEVPVYQIHNIATAEQLLMSERAKGFKEGLHHLELGAELNRIIREDPEIRWKVIVGVREPIHRWVSDIFQNINERYSRFVEADGEIRYDELIAFIKHSLETEPMQTWFDEELKAVFGVNLSEIGFDKERGYCVHRYNGQSFLFYRLESLKSASREMFDAFFPHKNIELINGNESSNKSYFEQYRTLLEQLKFDEDYLREFYNNISVARFFYSDTDIDQFIKKWSKKV